MNINDIKELLRAIDSTNLGYVKLETGDFKIEASRKAQCIDDSNNIKSELTTKKDLSEIAMEELTTIDYVENTLEESSIVAAPLMGTFYESPSPDSDNFVKVGDIVEEGDTLCILEAMKLMNEIKSEIKGEIVEVLVKNEELVEYNQPLFKIKPIK